MHNKPAYFVSDLHLFARRSQAPRHMEAIRAHARRASTFVLGGDIFDFRWSTVGSHRQTVEAASDWLESLLKSAPDCRIHLLLGNHDHHQTLIDRLKCLAADHDNFNWDAYLLRIGNNVFLHGDAADGDGSHDRLVAARETGHDHRRRGPAANAAYDAVLKTRVHRAIPVVAYPKRRTARRLLRYLDQVGHGKETEVRDIYFGHTHRPVKNYACDGVHFHNGGAPIRGVPFRIVRIKAAA